MKQTCSFSHNQEINEVFEVLWAAEPEAKRVYCFDYLLIPNLYAGIRVSTKEDVYLVLLASFLVKTSWTYKYPTQPLNDTHFEGDLPWTENKFKEKICM